MTKSTILPQIKHRIIKPRDLSQASPKLNSKSKRGLNLTYPFLEAISVDSQEDNSPLKSVDQNNAYLDRCQKEDQK
jgi:hypothetical protein